MSVTKSPPGDPKEAGPKPTFPEQKQSYPGSEEAMDPKPDYGEKSYRGSGRLEKRVALITGADSGIGRAVALAFAREGADILFGYLNEDADAKKTEEIVAESGRKAVGVPGDIQNEKVCQELVARAVKEFGRLDVLVNNAAFQMTREKIDELSSEEFDRTFRTNIYAMFHLCKAALPVMKPGASIINVASIQAYDPSPQLLAYATTKSAIIGFTKALAKQAMERGVRVNAVAPGPVWTPLIPATMGVEKSKNFGKNTVFQRPAQPAEMAPIFVWLASPEASYITGEVYAATGGNTPF